MLQLSSILVFLNNTDFLACVTVSFKLSILQTHAYQNCITTRGVEHARIYQPKMITYLELHYIIL
jgi:hypothetical protein